MNMSKLKFDLDSDQAAIDSARANQTSFFVLKIKKFSKVTKGLDQEFQEIVESKEKCRLRRMLANGRGHLFVAGHWSNFPWRSHTIF